MKAINSIENDYEISAHSRFLKKNGFISAAIYYKNLNETYQRRASRSLRYMFESAKLPCYSKGQIVYADNKNNMNGLMRDNNVCYVNPDGVCVVNKDEFSKIETNNALEFEIKKAVMANSENALHDVSNVRWLHYGLHHILDFEYVLENGIIGYKKDALKALETETDFEKIQFYNAMLDLTEGITEFCENYNKSLTEIENPDEDLLRLISATKTVPLSPATNFYEAFITIDSLMFICNCFEPGRIDKMLYPYFESDETVDEDFAYKCIRSMLSTIEKRLGHPGTTHVTVGGSKADGTADYNKITEICVKAIGGIRSPNMSLRVREDMPQKLWDLYLDNTSKGYTQPAIVNERMYINGLVNQYNVPMEDAVNYVFGGCSEVMIQGKSCCDSIWTAFNVLDIFSNTIFNELMSSENYDDFYSKFIRDLDVSLEDMKTQINLRQHAYGKHNPFPLRTLFTDCMGSAKNYADGGTKYNFDSTNIYGSTNTINSLYTMKQFFKGKLKGVTKKDILVALSTNYDGFEKLQKDFLNIEKYGNFNTEINEITTDLMTYIPNKIKTFRCYRGNGYFMPAIILWIAAETFGNKVCATPDGRGDSDVLADSAGPSQGSDMQGPTSTMGATLAIPQENFVGTSVLNLRLDSKNFQDEIGRFKVKQLCSTYFSEGGTQLQINVVDRETLLDALKNPEKHKDVIVRVGGFSDNFIYLSDKLKEQIIKRTEF
ncbi:MAG: pyruvate formate lyase family protein [Clostridia bacterium]